MASVVKKGDRVVCVGEYLSTFGQEGTVLNINDRERRARVKYDKDGFTIDNNYESLEVIENV